MQRYQGVLHIGAGLLLLMALLALGPGPASGDPREGYASMEREALIKDLGLTPEQAKAFQAVGDKCDKSRESIIPEIKSKEDDLEKVLAAGKPDEARVRELVAAITQDHDRFFQILKSQRQEEMALLNPIQQGRFILALKKWHEQMRGGPGK